MFFPTRLIGAAALFSGFAVALPRPDSAIGNEVAVSAPNGTPISADAMNTTSATASTVVTAAEVSNSPSGNSGNVGSGWASQTWTSTQAWTTATSIPSYGSAGGSSWSSYPSYGSGSSYSAPSYDSGSSWSSYSSYGSGSSYSAPSYGSGSSSWGNQNYKSCVQQCVASFGNPSATYTPPTATSVSGSGSSASGATHTVIVAPTQGLLRFVPFALNASVGDTIQFNWGANNHTVTKSSSLTPCNKTSDSLFNSGKQDKGFVFTQVVNDTNTTFFYCGTPTHCGKGMFGIINPPNALGSPSSASGMMPPLAANDSTFAAYANYTNSKTAGNAAAAGWGGSIDMSSLPTWAHTYAAENIMYTRTFLAANSEVLQKDGFMNLASAGSAPLIYPQDLSVAVNSTGATSTASLPSVSVSASSSPLPSASSLGSSASNAAISTSSSKILLGLGVVVGFATYMMF